MKKHLLLVPAAALILLGAGCASSDSEKSDTAARVPAVVEEEGMQIPAEFTKDIPVYENATVTNVEVEDGGGRLSISTSDSMATVASWYDAQLTAAGWEKTAGSEGKSISAVYEKDKMSIAVSVLQVGSEIRANISKTTY